ARRVAPSLPGGLFLCANRFRHSLCIVRCRLANNQRACYLSSLRVRTLAGPFFALTGLALVGRFHLQTSTARDDGISFATPLVARQRPDVPLPVSVVRWLGFLFGCVF